VNGGARIGQQLVAMGAKVIALGLKNKYFCFDLLKWAIEREFSINN
jgi:hypothetical protein